MTIGQKRARTHDREVLCKVAGPRCADCRGVERRRWSTSAARASNARAGAWTLGLTPHRVRTFRLSRSVFRSVPDLTAAVEESLAFYNEEPRPFVWTASADAIVAKTGVVEPFLRRCTNLGTRADIRRPVREERASSRPMRPGLLPDGASGWGTCLD